MTFKHGVGHICCCLSPRVGCIIIGLLTLIWAAFYIVNATHIAPLQELHEEKFSNQNSTEEGHGLVLKNIISWKALFCVQVTWVFPTVVSALLLLVTVKSKLEGFANVFLAWSLLDIILRSCLTGIYIWLYLLHPESYVAATSLALTIIPLVFEAYGIAVVLVHRVQIIHKRKQIRRYQKLQEQERQTHLFAGKLGEKFRERALSRLSSVRE